MFTVNKVAADAFNYIPQGAGLVLSKFDPAKPVTPPDEDILFATDGGINASCTATYVDGADGIDNVPAGAMEFQELDGWECKLTFTAVTMNATSAKIAIGPATVTDNKITPKDTLELSDFTDQIWLIVKMGKKGLIAICLKHVLSTSGMSLQTTNKGKGKFTVDLTGHVSASNVTECPMEIYIIQEVTE